MLCESAIRDHFYSVLGHKVIAELEIVFAASTGALVGWHNCGHSGVFVLIWWYDFWFLVSVCRFICGFVLVDVMSVLAVKVIAFPNFFWFLDCFAGGRSCKEIWQRRVPLGRHEKTCSAFELSIWSTTRLPLYREWMCATPNFKVSANSALTSCHCTILPVLAWKQEPACLLVSKTLASLRAFKPLQAFGACPKRNQY